MYKKVTRNEKKTIGMTNDINNKPFWVFSRNIVAQGPFNMINWVIGQSLV